MEEAAPLKTEMEEVPNKSAEVVEQRLQEQVAVEEAQPEPEEAGAAERVLRQVPELAARHPR